LIVVVTDQGRMSLRERKTEKKLVEKKGTSPTPHRILAAGNLEKGGPARASGKDSGNWISEIGSVEEDFVWGGKIERAKKSSNLRGDVVEEQRGRETPKSRG